MGLYCVYCALRTIRKQRQNTNKTRVKCQNMYETTDETIKHRQNDKTEEQCK